MESRNIDYWRDRVSNILQWAGAVFILFVGWSIDHYERFKIKKPWPEGRNEIVAASGLIFITLLYSIFLLLGIKTIYKKFLNQVKKDNTVLSYPFAMWCASVLALLTLGVALLLVFI
jgi:hypothetical protein